MTDQSPGSDDELTFAQRRILADAGVTDNYTAPTVDCPHRDGSAEAEAWWRAEWNKAVAWAKVKDEYNGDDDLPVELPPFPVDVLPEPMKALVRSVSANKSVPVDLPALLSLACVALVAGPRLVISRGADWLEPLTEWTLTILESGQRKSPAFEVFNGILRKIERRLAELHADDIAVQIGELRERIESKVQQPIKDGDTAPDVDKNAGADTKAKVRAAEAKREQRKLAGEVKMLNDQIEKLEDAPPPRLLVGGSSGTEAIESAMAANRGAIGIFDDEGGAFGAVSGIYSNGVPTGLDTILKSYSGTNVRANVRITRAAEPVPRAILTYGLACQSAPVVGSFRVPQLRDRGFHSRWLYAMPEPVVENLDPPPLHHDAVHAFTRLLIALVDRLPVIDAERLDPGQYPALHLSERALKLHREIQAEIRDRKDPDTGDLAFMVDWANKLAGRILRHAGLLHLGGGLGEAVDVSEESMRSAIEIGRWAIAHASAVYRRAPRMSVGRGRDEDAAMPFVRGHVERWIRKQRRPCFTARDVQRNLRRHSWYGPGSVDVIQAALLSLADEWVVRIVPRTDAAGKCLPGAPWFVTNPVLIYGQ